jgi:hypothetical protein
MIPTLQELCMDQNVKNILRAPPLIKEMIIDTTILKIKQRIHEQTQKDMQKVIHRELSIMKSLVPEIILDISAGITRDYYKKYPSLSPTTINYARDSAKIYLGIMET